MVRLFIASDFLHFMPAEKEKIRMKEALQSLALPSLQSRNDFKSFQGCCSRLFHDWQGALVNGCRECKGFLISFYHETDVDCGLW